MFDSQRMKKTDMCVLHKAAILIVFLMLTYNYHHTKPNIEVRVPDPKFSLLGPHNTTLLKVEDVYEQLIDLKNFSFKMNPQPCAEYQEGLLLVVFVTTNPKNFENREVIRNTWGKKTDSNKIVFLIGESENVTIASHIKNESLKYNDIVQGNFVDAYRNMTYKHVMGLKWVSHHCPMAKYVLKTDDDVLVNMLALKHFLARELSPWGANNLITCNVIEKALAQRSKNSKWQVSTSEYSSEYYPPYCLGWAILYSQDVIPRLLKAAQSAPYFWIDDVQITGVLADQIGVARTHINSLTLSYYAARVFTSFGPNYSGPFIFGPPDLSVRRILQIWEALQEY